jgi:hypothetical protein
MAATEDRQGSTVAALWPYRVATAVQHPEYRSERMMQAFEALLGQGARVAC